MMKRITLKYKGKDIVSDAFNMKAFRAIYETLVSGAGLQNAGLQGLVALFDGTEITEDIIIGKWHELDSGAVEDACLKLHGWFAGVNIKTDSKGAKEQKQTLFPLYTHFIRKYLYLPSDIDKQDPQMLFDIFQADVDSSGQDQDTGKLPENLQGIYKV